MSTKSVESSGGQNLAQWLLNKKTWTTHFLIVAAISVAGLVYLGQQTYSGSPPLVDYVSADTGEVVLSQKEIERGKEVFHLRGLMGYGSFWGDGGDRGPDFTADALHRTAVSMREYYTKEMLASTGAAALTEYERDAIGQRVMRELRNNTYNEAAGTITLNAAQINAFKDLNVHYTRMFTDPTYKEHMDPINQVNGAENLRALTGFFFWGGWVSVANRPGETYSYTHNWPYDPEVGNVATTATFIWSMVSIFFLWIGISVVLYVYGQMKMQEVDVFDSSEAGGHSLTTADLENGYVRPTQKATYKFFALAIICFGIQVFMGIVGATDFVRPFGVNLNELMPFTVARSYHTLLQIFWFFMAWVGYTIFFLPRLAKVPKGQLFLINLLFAMSVVVALGAVFGIYTGQRGYMNDLMSYWFGSQGWEFIELGRFFQLLLLTSFVLWIFIIYRGVKPWVSMKNAWSVPAWLLWGSGVMVLFLFFSVLMTPNTNFAISDYWRWMTVHMWVEVTFEVFTTVIVAYLLVQMGLVTRLMAERVIFLAVMLFFVTAINGISHNFYWIAKPTGIIAVGSVFSTLQVLPLLLLTLDAWQMRQESGRAHELRVQGKQMHVMEAVWLFILGVNFWNIFGAGVFGSLITLPIVNYYEHATYMTLNHAHAAMFGVKGNVALAGMLFCCQHLFQKSAWNEKLVRTAFWSLNIGIALMMFLDMFPVGLYQIWIVLTEGYWAARTSDVILGPVFATLTYLRSIGGAVFVFGGLLPLMYFVLSRGARMNPETDTETDEWKAYQSEYGDEFGREWSTELEPKIRG